MGIDLDGRMEKYERDMTFATAHKTDEYDDVFNWVETSDNDIIQGLKDLGNLKNCSFEQYREPPLFLGIIGRVTIGSQIYDIGKNTCHELCCEDASALTLYLAGGKVIDLSNEKEAKVHKNSLDIVKNSIEGKYSQK